jgi:anti-sigma regulatory factor (Ser/Thr protein kinase)
MPPMSSPPHAAANARPAQPRARGSAKAGHLVQATQWITAAALAHPQDLAQQVMQRLDISRPRAGRLLKALQEAQWLTNRGSTRRPRWQPGALRQVVRQYPRAGLQEDQPWRQDFAPNFELPAEVQKMAQHAFTELLNNAIDHSGGTQVTVSMRQTPLQVQLLVSDDGCGLFERISQSFAIDDPALAMFELSKGKLSSAPAWHCGRGLFYTARLADVFDVHANSAGFQHRAWCDEFWRPARALPRAGTSVYLAIALDTARTLDTVLRSRSLNGNGYGLDSTEVPLALLAPPGGHALLLSRADARRVTARLPRFGRAEIDFSGIESVGHGFADELFRVFRREHPSVELLAKKMAPQVGAMVASVSDARR